MGATVTLSSTTLAQAVNSGDGLIKVTSTAGMTTGMRLFIDRELMTVLSLGVNPWVNVLRGRDGTAASAHNSLATIWIGRADQFYADDPIGAPAPAFSVSPYINVNNGKVWFAQGDALSPAVRWWQAQTTTYDVGALGIRTTVVSPTSST